MKTVVVLLLFGAVALSEALFGSNSGSDSRDMGMSRGSSGSSMDRGSGSNNFGSSNNGRDSFPLTGSGSRNSFTSNSGMGSDSDFDMDDEFGNMPRINGWPNGKIPYEISSDIADSDAKTLKRMLNDLSDATCVQFVPHRNEANYTLFKSGNKCSAPLGVSNNPMQDSSMMGRDRGSSMGGSGSRSSFGSSSPTRNSFSSMNSGASQVVLAKSCFQTKRLARRLMNLLGIPHETSRPDRDMFVTINPNNIRAGYAANLKQIPASAYLPGVLDIPYDLQSVTQYADIDLAKDQRTWAIKPKNSRMDARDLGGDNFSQADLNKIQKAYGCRITNSRSRTG